MTTYTIERLTHRNAGIAREWALCRYYKVERTAHDALPYDKGSDLDAAGKHISIKASAFTLMSGSLCEGRDTFDGIWDLYAERVHSDTFAYITEDFRVYEMGLDEFKQFGVRGGAGADRQLDGFGGRGSLGGRSGFSGRGGFGGRSGGGGSGGLAAGGDAEREKGDSKDDG